MKTCLRRRRKKQMTPADHLVCTPLYIIVLLFIACFPLVLMYLTAEKAAAAGALFILVTFWTYMAMVLFWNKRD